MVQSYTDLTGNAVIDSPATFIKMLKMLAEAIHKVSRDKGFYDNPREDGTLLCMIHGEVSEAMEANRKSNPPDKHLPEFSSEEVELGDSIIRILDYAEHKGYNLGPAILAKVLFNTGRPRMHGNNLY